MRYFLNYRIRYDNLGKTALLPFLMKPFLLSAITKLGLLGISLGLGVGGYLLLHHPVADPNGTVSYREGDPAVLLSSEIVLDAEAHLLAKAEHPVDAVGDALGVIYILQSDGRILRVAPEVGGATLANEYANLGDQHTETKIGFSSVALHPFFLFKKHPGYGRFYVIVAEKAGSQSVDFRPEFGGATEHHQDVVYEYCVEDPLLSEFRGTRRELMRFSQPGPGHNARGLAFDPEGFLYLGVGDGDDAPVSRQSPSRNASSLTNAYGKVLRIDPLGMDSDNGQYGIPRSNPFRLVTEALPELWAFGLRAPHSLSYDPFQRGLCIGERAGSTRETINLSLYGGEHFGWDLSEGSLNWIPAIRSRLFEIVTAPTVALDLQSGLTAHTSGSLVYRGESFPSLAGALLLASHDGQLLALRANEDANEVRQLTRINLGQFGNQHFAALRSSPRGELIFLCDDGSVIEMRKGATLGTEGGQQHSLFCLR